MTKKVKLAAIWSVIALSITICVILFGTRTYHSESLLLLRLGRENVAVDPTASTGEVLHVQTNRDSEVKTILGMLSSRDIAKDVVATLGAGPIVNGFPAGTQGKRKSLPKRAWSFLKNVVASLDPISDEEAALKELYSGIRFKATDRQSNVISVEYITKSPELAQQVVDLWVKSFLELHPEINRAKGSLEFFHTQLKEFDGKLFEARERFKEAKNRASLVTVVDQQRVLSEQISASRLREASLVSSLAASDTRVKTLTELLESVDTRIVLEERTGLANAATDGMRQQLYDLEIQEKGLTSSYTADHPFVLAIQTQLENASKIVDSANNSRNEVTEGSNPAYWRLYEQLVVESANREAVGSELTAVRKISDSLEKHLQELNDEERRIRTCEQRVEILEQRYAGLHTKMEEARLDEELQSHQITSINIVQSASLEYQPVSPQKTLCALVGLFAAAVGWFGPWLLARPTLTAEWGGDIANEKARMTVLREREFPR